MTNNTNPFLQQLNAQPDGNYHATKTQLKKLAEFEATNPFDTQVTWQSMLKYNINENMLEVEEYKLVKFIEDYITNKKLDLSVWRELVKNVFNKQFYSDIFKHVFSTLLQQVNDLHNDEKIEVIRDIIILYSVTKSALKEKVEENTANMPRIETIYESIKSKNVDEKKLLSFLSDFLEQHKEDSIVQEVLTYLFPLELGLTTDMISTYLDAYIYSNNMMDFFDKPELFACIYWSTFYDKMSEPHLLLMQKHHESAFLKIISHKFYSLGCNLFTDGIRVSDLGKVRRYLKFIRKYHHQGSLLFILENSHEYEIASEIKYWLEQFPMFSLRTILTHLQDEQRSKGNDNNIKTQVEYYLDSHPAIIKVYKETLEADLLNNLSTKPDNQQTLELLAKLTKNITEQQIESDYQQAIATNDKESQTNKKPSKKSNEVKKIKFPALPLNPILTPTGNEYKVVPHYINDFNSKGGKDNMIKYFQQYPETVVNETVYLLFSKQTDSLLKKAKTSAKLFWDWLIDNQRDLLLEVITNYDNQLTEAGDKPKLVTFLADYEQNSIALAQQQQALLDASQQLNEQSIPFALLNDDWQKATRKRDFEIPSYLPKNDLPVLVVAKTGEPLPKDVFERVLQMLMIQVSKPIPNLLNNLNLMTEDSQQALAEALWSVFMHTDGISKSQIKWLFMASGLLYHANLDDEVWSVIKMCESESTERSIIKYAIEALAEQAMSRHQLGESDSIPADRALRMLMKISEKSRPSIRPNAEEQIQRYGEKVGLTADDIADRLIPTLGLNAQGKREFDFGDRQFIMSLDSELKPTFTDNSGKKFKNLPKAGQQDDEYKGKVAHDALKEIKKQIKSFKQDDMKRFEKMMLNQKRVTIDNFLQFYVRNPLMLRVTYSLIWGIYDESNKIVQPFRVVETGEILDINDDELDLSNLDLLNLSNLSNKEDANEDSTNKDDTNQLKIGLVHPIDLTEEQRGYLVKSLQEEEIFQPFLQMGRAIYQMTETEKASNNITRFDNEKFSRGSFFGLRSKGWDYGQHEGYCEGFGKQMSQHYFSFLLTDGFYFGEGVPEDDHGIGIVAFEIDDSMTELEFSECMYEIDSMTRL